MDPRYQLVRADVRRALESFPLENIVFVKDNRHRLIRGKYHDEQGNGCLFGLLSHCLPRELRIDSRESLTRFFTGGSGERFRELPEYQPARWLVRLIDGERVERYGGLNFVSWDFLIECLDEVIAERTSIETESAAVEADALARMGHSPMPTHPIIARNCSNR